MSFIHAEQRGAVGIITIDRPDRFNSLDVDTAQDLRKAGLLFARDEAVRAVILRGLPKVFCSGADLKYIREGGVSSELGYLQPASSSESRSSTGYGEIFKQILEYIHSTISEIKRAPKPFIAAVEGMAAAGGFGLAMSCDLVYAGENAVFEWAYHKTGLTGAESSTFFLPRLVGLRRAIEIVFLNPRMNASQALDLGLITGVVHHGAFNDKVMEIAERLAEGPTEAYGVAKRLINQADGVDRLDFHLDRELENLTRIADGKDFAEGLEAFFEKRQATFAGR